jgi:hypothetical protein
MNFAEHEPISRVYMSPDPTVASRLPTIKKGWKYPILVMRTPLSHVNNAKFVLAIYLEILSKRLLTYRENGR